MENELASRRRFLKLAAFGAGSLGVLPPEVALSKTSASGVVAPSRRVNVAFVGTCNKGSRNRVAFLRSGLCNVVALCDVQQEQRGAMESAAAHPKARQYTDFRKMFDEMADQIDAVVVSTPDHSHFAASMLAMSLGKAVWCEKPLTRTFGESQRMMNLAKKSGVVTQMGNQGHSSANHFQFDEWTKEGVIHDITKIDSYMNRGRRWTGWGAGCKGYPSDPLPGGMNWDAWVGPAQMNSFSKKLHPANWRCWFEYGNGALGDWAPHILDTCHRFLKLGLPEKISEVKMEGRNEFVFPQASTIRWSVPARDGMPACEVNWFDGPGNPPSVDEEYGPLSADGKTREPLKLGDAGKLLYSDDLVFKGGTHSEILQVVPRERFLEMRRDLPRFQTKCSDHWANFLLACLGEEKARSPFEVSGPLTQFVLLGVICQRLGGELDFDSKSKRFTNSEAANALLDPAPRKGWEEFYQM